MSGRRVEIRPAAAAGLALLTALDPAGLCLPFLLAAALHEGGHLLCLRLCRVPLVRLRIGLLGAVLETGARSRREELCCAAAGPAVNLALGLLLGRIAPVFAWLNLLLALWNLLPVFPLDGGRVLSALLPRAAAAVEAAVLAALFLAAAVLTAVLHCGLWPALLLGALGGKMLLQRTESTKEVML